MLCAAAVLAAPVDIPDAALRHCVERELEKAAGAAITEADMASMTSLDCRAHFSRHPWLGHRIYDPARSPHGAVKSLEGLQHAVNLADLDISHNAVADLSPLAGLTALTVLAASGNSVADIAPLAGLTALRKLWLGSNPISDISPLGGLTRLERLDIPNNNIADVSALASLTSLTYLHLSVSPITDISAFAGLTALKDLYMSQTAVADISALSGLTSLTSLVFESNKVWDISALTANSGFDSDSSIALAGNPLGCAAVSDVATLRATGAWVSDGFAEAAPPMPADLAAAVGNGGATLTWSGDGNPRVYELRHRPGGADAFNAWEMVPGGGEAGQHTVSGLAAGDHVFEVRGVNNAGCGVAASVSATISAAVEVPDTALRQCIEGALNKPAGAALTVSEMATLSGLTCRDAGIAALTGLEAATSLAKLDLSGNAIGDASPLGALASLTYVGLRDNNIANVAELASNTHLGTGDTVDVRGNPLDAAAFSAHIPALQRRGATVHFDASPVVSVPDAALRHCLARRWRITGDITVAALSVATSLNCRAYFASGDDRSYDPIKSPHGPIGSLEGLQHAVNLADLNITDNAVVDLSPLAGLPLTSLDVSGNSVADLSSLAGLPLTSLDVGGNAVADLSPLAGLPLTSLRISGTAVSDLSPLAGLTSLTVLTATGSSVADIAPLAGLTSLQELWVGANAISDVSPLAGLTRLRKLNLGANEVTDVSALAKLTSLTYIGLYGNAIVNVSALRHMTRLEAIYLNNNRIADVGPLALNTGLGEGDYLELLGNPVDAEARSTHIPALRGRGVTVYFDDDPVQPAPEVIPDAALRHCVERQLNKADATVTEADLASLTSLNCRARFAVDGDRRYDPERSPHGAVGSLEGLQHAVNLAELDISDNAVADLSPLAGLPLTSLDISHTGLTSLSGLAPLTTLTTLRISGVPAADLSPLAGLTSLTVLAATGSSAADIAPLGKLTALRELWLGANAIWDVAPLAGLTRLRKLNLGANKITDVSALAELTSLTYLGLYGNAIVDVSALRHMTRLSELHLQNNRIGNIAGLAVNTGLGLGDYIDLTGNPIPCGANAEQVRSLVDRGATVYADAVPVPAPQELVATPGDTVATLSWQAPPGCVVTGWEFRHGTGKSPVFGGWTAIGGDALRHSVAGLTNGILHVFEVRPVGVGGAGQHSRVDIALAEAPDAPVEIPDAQLRDTVSKLLAAREQSARLGRAERGTSGAGSPGLRRKDSSGGTVIRQADMATLTSLDLNASGIAMLDGLEFALNLRTLKLRGNDISNVGPVSQLPLLSTLWLGYNQLADIAPLRELSALTELALEGNRISDIAALADLPLLTRLWLNDNAIVDIAPLAANTGLGGGEARPDGSSDYIDLRGNPLDTAALDAHAPALRQRGAAVLVDDGTHSVPLFLRNGSSFGQAFARVVNRAARAGEVRIAAIDAMGRRYGPARLRIDARQTAHFNSADLELGNAAKGLVDGVGYGQGDWRLELRSTLDLEVSAYARSATGSVASLNDVVPEAYAQHRVFTLAPGNSANQVGRLRVINPTAKAARVRIEGVDDLGAAASTAVTVPAGGARDFTAADLEAGIGDGIVEDGLGEGAGMWRLTATSYDGVQLLSLLEGGAQLTNLSSAPSVALGASRHVPLFAAAAPEREGFLRLVNMSGATGDVELRAFDQDGLASAPASLTLGPGGAQVDWRDLARGNAAKGLPSGIGEGNWRLEVRAALDVRALNYLRADGSINAMHPFAPQRDDGASHVAFFNPASNRNTASRLRLVNVGTAAAQVAITGVDDRGESPGGVVRTAVPAGATRTFTAAELETGASALLSGALGDGTGKWRLRVESTSDVYAVSLLETPDGRLVNVSR